MAKRKHGDAARGLFFTALSGRRDADVSGTSRGDLRGMLLAAFGPSRRDPARPDTRAAADALGVTPRTVQRWLAAPGRERIVTPRGPIMARIAAASRAAATTKRGRAAAIAATRASNIAKHGLRVTIHGVQGPRPDSVGGVRDRKAAMRLSPEHANAFFDAYESGGENGALGWLAGHSEEVYGIDGWFFGDVKGVDLGPMSY